MDLNLFLFPIFILLFLLVVVLLIWSFFEKIRARGLVSRSLNMKLLSVALPRLDKAKESKPEKEIIAIAEQFYASISTFKIKGFINNFLYGNPSLVFELAVSHIGEQIQFYVAVPRRYEDILQKTIHSFYPDASVEQTDDYNIFNPEGRAVGAFFKLTKDSVLPFKTYKKLETDPLQAIANSLSKLEETGEGAVIQILIRPASGKWRSRALKIIQEMKGGKSFKIALAKVGRNQLEKAVGDIATELSGKKDKKEDAPIEQKKDPLQEEAIKILEEKVSKTVFETNIRVLVSATTEMRAEHIFDQIKNAFNQYTDPNFNELKAIYLKKRALDKMIFNFSFRIFSPNEMIILNTEELTSLYHFSGGTLETPKVKFVEAKFSPPPADLPKQGIVIGKNLYRGVENVVRMTKDDRRRHLYMIGQTGTGKSSLLVEMAKQDIEAGEGIGVLDPHGDLVERILALVPKERAEDVVFCDPSHLAKPFGLNMLEYDANRPEQKTNIINELMNIFGRLYDLKATGGPMFEQYMRNALLLLMDDPNEPVTLLEVPRVLADKEYRMRLLEKCKNIVAKDFWEKEAEKAGGEAALVNVVPYITSKFNVFIANDYLRPIISQTKSSFNFREIIDTKKILLVNLAKGRLGDINSSLLGSIFVSKLLIAAFEQGGMPEEQRKDFYLYIDEFQNFVTESISTILAEARKYRLDLIVAHQFIKQLPVEISSAVFGNVGSKICFRVGSEDAPIMIKDFEPVFNEYDLINVPNLNFYIKMLINGKTNLPFNVQLYPWSKGDNERANLIKELSILKYGRDREMVESEAEERRNF